MLLPGIYTTMKISNMVFEIVITGEHFYFKIFIVKFVYKDCEDSLHTCNCIVCIKSL